MKKNIKLLEIGVIVLVISMFILASLFWWVFEGRKWGSYSMIRVYVNEENYEKFDAMEFTIGDFNCKDIKSFSYQYFDMTVDEENEVVLGRNFLVKLKTNTKWSADKTIKRLKNLDFAERITYHYSGASPSKEYKGVYNEN